MLANQWFRMTPNHLSAIAPAGPAMGIASLNPSYEERLASPHQNATFTPASMPRPAAGTLSRRMELA